MDRQNTISQQRQPSPKLQEWRKIFLYATITLFSVSALLGIFFILFGTDAIGGKVIATTAILGVFSLFTMNNIIRLENKGKSVRYSAVGALVSNVIWLVPSILMLWGFFEIFRAGCYYPSYSSYSDVAYAAYEACVQPYYTLQEVVGKIINTACVVSIVLTLISNFMSFKNYTSAIVVLKTATIACGIVLGTYEIGIVDFNGRIDGEFWRILAIVGIILVFGLIVTPILVKIGKKKEETPIVSDAGEQKPIDEAALRAQIEQEVRAKIAAEKAETEKTVQDDNGDEDQENEI